MRASTVFVFAFVFANRQSIIFVFKYYKINVFDSMPGTIKGPRCITNKVLNLSLAEVQCNGEG